MKYKYNSSEVKPLLTKYPKRIVLIGFATGYKTSVGKLLASRLNCAFVDTDAQIENTLASSVQQIFETYGEEYFRQAESKLLRQLNEDNIVVACGGGSVLADGFDEFARDSIVIWLTVEAATVRSRLGNTQRPLFDKLTVEELEAYINKRAPLYAKYASVKFSTDGKTPQEVTAQVYDWLRRLL
ncbi:MAG: shikimate kinase [Clostridiales bacterium]|nr:shikimate kinase [Clostridiales bacterium]